MPTANMYVYDPRSAWVQVNILSYQYSPNKLLDLLSLGLSLASGRASHLL